MTLAGAGWAEEERILVLGDEAPGGQLVEEMARDLLVEVEGEILQPFIRIAEGRLLAATLEQPVGALGEFVLHERGDEVDRSHALGACLLQARLQHGGHATKAQLLERTIELDEVHWESSCFIWAIRSR